MQNFGVRMMFFSGPALATGVYLATHLSAESFSIEKVVAVTDDGDGA